MVDLGDIWRGETDGCARAARDKRAANREWNANQLRKHGIAFEQSNGDGQLLIRHAGRVVDFAPGTGYFKIRTGGTYGRLPPDICNHGRGLGVLMRYLRRLEGKTT